MTFVLRMTLREIRSSWRRLMFFFVCLAVGVAAIVAVRSVIQSVQSALSREAQSLIAADLLVRSNQPLSDVVRATLDREQAAGRITAQAEAIEIATIVRSADEERPATKMVELRAVEEGFPFYGTLTMREGAYSHELLQGGGTLVRPELLAQLGLEVGDSLLIGTEAFEIRGVIAQEPGRSLGVFTLGPRILIDEADLDSTGLISFGSRADFEILLKVPALELLPLERDLEEAFGNEFVRVRSYQRSEDRMGRNLARAEDYLSLVGLVVLILGGIGVSSVTRVFVQQKVKSIAVLKCVGGTWPQVMSVYMAQVLLLGLAGSVLGVALAAGVIAMVPTLVGDLADLLQVDYGLTAGAVVQGLAVGVLVAALFSLVPLLEVRHVKPSLLLRQDIPPIPTFDWLKWSVTAAVAASLVGVASWQAGSLEVGLLLSGGFVGIAVLLHIAGAGLIWAVQPLRHSRSFALRQAVLHVARPGNQTRVILLAVGLGAFFILGVRNLQVNLVRDFAVQVGEDSPDMFLMDIQPDQREGVEALIDEANGAQPAPALMPVLRARIVGVRGQGVNLESYEAVRGRGRLSREYTVTYRSNLEENETLTGGEWWDETPALEQAEVSVEDELRERFGIEVGDLMNFDVLGRVVTARVASFREVDFRDFRAGGFMIVFRPGTFEEAPHTFIAAANAPLETEARARMQGSLARQFPNVSVIDLREVMDSIQSIVTNVTLAVSVVGALVLFSGSLILIGAVSMTKFRRVYEASILRTLGASSRLVGTMLLFEYGVLGAIAGTVGALGAVVLSWAIARYALDLPWEATPLLTVIGIAATTVFVAAIGVLASLDVLRHKPLATLRAE